LVDFPGSVVSGPQFVDTPDVDIDAPGFELLRECNRERESDVTKTEDGNAGTRSGRGIGNWDHLNLFLDVGWMLAGAAVTGDQGKRKRCVLQGWGSGPDGMRAEGSLSGFARLVIA